MESGDMVSESYSRSSPSSMGTDSERGSAQGGHAVVDDGLVEDGEEQALLGSEGGEVDMGIASPLDAAVERLGIGRFHKVAVAVLGLANASDAVELLAIGYILPELNKAGAKGFHVTDAQKGFLSAAVFVGMLIGGLFCGLASDRVGRKAMLLWSLGINALAGLASAAAPSWPLLLTARIISGIGVGGSVPSVFTMAVEYLPVHRRGFYLTVVAWHWMVGSIFTASLAWILLGAIGASWRVFAAACAGPAALAFVLTLVLLPETPRFLVAKGRYAAAASVLNRMARRSGHTTPLLGASGAELAPNGPSNIQAGSVPAGSLDEPARETTPSAWRLLDPALRRTTISLAIVWFGLSFGWYGLILWIPTLFDDANLSFSVYASVFIVAAANLPGNIVSAVLMDRIGRKNVLVGTMTTAAGLGVLFAFSHRAGLVITVASAFNAVSIGGWNALDCLSSESFPTPLRTSAMGVLAAFGRLGSMSAQFVNGFLISHSVALLLLVTAGTMFIGGLGALALPRDTSGMRVADKLHG
ncbi:major facilitator superfamily transporter [Thecamonas trahens ATCC 50062]|uniref:Major facilitator superfamily transporter n=1 Tax=Thecamonas trahens ATCC 50062 TaxID=461836 RepID=A0A0L0D841_THETB|nr:major facilitator superfamily transporter [Thecamonas trahens ATCC 50062]KNC48400.1 major facilitator superfamily transporter [Thecamonas trahens ATCC 50062]|eukprot:XP_013758517.1 major facilitator superfamily transporter [Thecamonas trahens ATCC 50062]